MKSLPLGKAGFALLFVLLCSGNTLAEDPKVTAAGKKNDKKGSVTNENY